MSQHAIHRASGIAVHGLSLFAMVLVVGAAALVKLGRLDPAPGGDEGAPAHLFQLAVALLLPAGLAFVSTADWRRPVRVLLGLAVPAVALVVAFTVLFAMEHPH